MDLRSGLCTHSPEMGSKRKKKDVGASESTPVPATSEAGSDDDAPPISADVVGRTNGEAGLDAAADTTERVDSASAVIAVACAGEAATSIVRALEQTDATFVTAQEAGVSDVRAYEQWAQHATITGAQTKAGAQTKDLTFHFGYDERPADWPSDLNTLPIAVEPTNELVVQWAEAAGVRTHAERDELPFTGYAKKVEVLVARAKSGEVNALTEVQLLMEPTVCSDDDATPDGVVQGGQGVRPDGGADTLTWVAECPAPFLDKLADGEALRGALMDAAERVTERASHHGLWVAGFEVDALGRFVLSGLSARLPRYFDVASRALRSNVIRVQYELAHRTELAASLRHAATEGRAAFCQLVAPTPLSNDGKDGDGSAKSAPWWPALPPRLATVRSCYDEVHNTLTTCDDPTVARITTYAMVRHDALHALDRLLAGFDISGLDPSKRTNRDALRNVIADGGFRAGSYDGRVVTRACHSDASNHRDSSN